MSKKHRVNCSHKKNDFASYLKANLNRKRDPKIFSSVSVGSAVDYLYNTFNNHNKGANK
jgi:hypothetical protein